MVRGSARLSLAGHLWLAPLTSFSSDNPANSKTIRLVLLHSPALLGCRRDFGGCSCSSFRSFRRIPIPILLPSIYSIQSLLLCVVCVCHFGLYICWYINIILTLTHNNIHSLCVTEFLSIALDAVLGSVRCAVLLLPSPHFRGPIFGVMLYIILSLCVLCACIVCVLFVLHHFISIHPVAGVPKNIIFYHCRHHSLALSLYRSFGFFGFYVRKCIERLLGFSNLVLLCIPQHRSVCTGYWIRTDVAANVYVAYNPKR